MKDARLWPLRMQAEKDQRLANASLLILLNILSGRNNSRDLAEDEFPLSWQLVSHWTGLSEKGCYNWLQHLTACGYLTPGPLKGCPAQRFYSVNFRPSSPENEGTGSIKNEGTRSLKNRGTSSPENGGHHISNSLREEKLNKGTSATKSGRGRKSMAAAPKKDGTTPGGQPPDWMPQRLTGDALKRFRAEERRKAGV